jgi:hypothetical protein
MTENISTAAANARESSRTQSGQFGTQPLSEAEIDLDVHESVSAEAAQAIKQGEAKGSTGSDQIWYFTGGPDEKLFLQEIDDVLAGRRDEVLGSIEDTYEAYIDNAQREAAEKACDEADVEWDDLDTDDQVVIVEAVRENSDPAGQLYDQLLRNTRPQLVRPPLEDHFENTYEQRAHQARATFGGTDEVDEIRKGLFTESLAAYGLDMKDPRNVAAVEELIAEGPHNHRDAVKLELITHNDVADPAPGATDKKLTFTDPTVLLIDSMNGSGYETKVYGQVVVDVPVTPERKSFYTDANAPGYGWDDAAGVVHSTYRTPVAVAEVPAAETVEEPAAV